MKHIFLFFHASTSLLYKKTPKLLQGSLSKYSFPCEKQSASADSSMEMSTQCTASVKRANSIVGITRKGTENKTGKIVMLLAKSIVHLYLDYSG